MNDQSARWQGWLHSGTVVHPDAPAGGSGPGSARLPGPLDSPAIRSTTLHPDAPAVRLYGLRRITSPGDGSESATAAMRGLNERVETLSDHLRRALPHPSLQAVYGRLVDQVKATYARPQPVGRGAPERRLTQRLHELVSWIDPPSFETLSAQGTASGGGGEAIVERTFETAARRLAELWDAASRAGTSQQDALRYEWSRRIEFPLHARAMDTGEESERQSERAVPRQPEPDKQKTWVEFQILDEQGNVLSDVAYDVTLPDGSHRTGRLNDFGKIRFENIDPGQCAITFPQIDGREWKPL